MAGDSRRAFLERGALVGCTAEQARGLSARGALLFVGRALPDNWLEPFVYSNSLIGPGGNAEVLAALSGNLTPHLSSPVTEVARLPDGRFAVRNAAGVVETVDLVVFATPPWVTRSLLPQRPALAKAAWVLGKFEYFPTEISIHRDPAYMPESVLHWSAYNARVEGDRCEGSVWYAPPRPPAEGQPPLLVFKSWATAREREPEDEVHRRRFLHPLVTPGFIAAQAVLEACQGRERIWFAGSYTREVDSQESALVSAVRVVHELAPDAPNLVALRS